MNVAEFKAYVQGVADSNPAPDVELQLIKAAIARLGNLEKAAPPSMLDALKPPPWAPIAGGGVAKFKSADPDYEEMAYAKTAKL